jgi:pimeloyl-ACP methyl ester carboxylesterase
MITSSVEIAAQGRRLDIEYGWVGEGERTLVFLHEGLGSVAMWKNFPGRLCACAGVRGLVFSRPGYGASTPRAGEERWPIDFMHR